MADFNEILTPGDIDNGLINVVVEIPEGSANKVEWNRDKKAFMLDRVEPKIFAKPSNYGFIPQTLDEDGDELDVFIAVDTPHDYDGKVFVMNQIDQRGNFDEVEQRYHQRKVSTDRIHHFHLHS